MWTADNWPPSKIRASIFYEGREADTVIGIHGRGYAGFETQGVIDDIRVYNRALSAEEVKALFLKEKPEGELQAGKVDQTHHDRPNSVPRLRPAIRRRKRLWD